MEKRLDHLTDTDSFCNAEEATLVTEVWTQNRLNASLTLYMVEYSRFYQNNLNCSQSVTIILLT